MHTRRSISPGYRLWSAILEHEAGVCLSFLKVQAMSER